MLNWIWGIGNNTFIALLMFVPFVNFIMLFILGAKGSKWAWKKNKKWESIEEFKAVQRKWAKWGGYCPGSSCRFFCYALLHHFRLFQKLRGIQTGGIKNGSQPRSIASYWHPFHHWHAIWQHANFRSRRQCKSIV